ncbi:DUF2388 domain-containing protein [Pseudomonas sp. PDM18]|nr:DUF2388 domain-containing protein [Pseudomonas sp. PDM18]
MNSSVCSRKINLQALVALFFAFYHGFSLGSPGNWDEKSLATLSTLGTFYSPIASVEWSSRKTSDISSDDRKVILLSHDDALVFVASDGGLRGALLEQAIRLLRNVGIKGSDMELAEAIIVSGDVVRKYYY